MTSVAVPILRIDGERRSVQDDALAIEEPLEIRLAFAGRELARARPEKSISITMRTPGDDVALALGFLVAEGVIRSLADIEDARHCGPPVRDDATSNIVKITLSAAARFDPERLERHFYTSSSCGVCGKTSLEAVRAAAHAPLLAQRPQIAPEIVHGLPQTLRDAQPTFDRTGGLHAAGLFDARGELLVVREDVGRHNAVDKVIGTQLRENALPLHDRVLLVSGRASFELVQKAVMAGIGILAAVGAPSSLAVELAREESMTVLGFVRDGRFNVYSGEGRILGAPT